jgi:hypothetical protein
VGHRIEKKAGRVISEQDAAKALVKIYTLALAQGIARTQWFEARDPIGEDAGFGLLNRDGSPRASYKALKELTHKSVLGPTPKYLGWVALGKDGRGYGFVFERDEVPVLIAWMPAGMSDKSSAITGDIFWPVAGTWKKGPKLEFTDTPIISTGLPPALVKQAIANAAKNFPWGGDYSNAKAVHFQAGLPDKNHGITPLGRASRPTITFADGTAGILMQGDISHPVSFYVHPSFANLQTKEYYVRVHVRRVAAGNVGMNLFYEVADSKGHGAYKNVGQWFGVSKDNGWQTYTWHVTDASFAKMWGYDFSIRPEQSVPFALGKVEVSTVPFQ